MKKYAQNLPATPTTHKRVKALAKQQGVSIMNMVSAMYAAWSLLPKAKQNQLLKGKQWKTKELPKGRKS